MEQKIGLTESEDTKPAQIGTVYAGPIVPGYIEERQSFKYLLPVLVAIAITFTGGIIAYFGLNLSKSPLLSKSNVVGSGSRQTGLTPLEKRLSSKPDALKKLHEINWPLYLPEGENLVNPYLINGATDKRGDLLTYGVNTKYGRGLLAGSYGYAVYPATSTYDPPRDCGVIGNSFAATSLACTKYSGSSRDIPAFIFNNYQPGSITDTAITHPISMYARRGDSVVVITSADTDPSVLYGLIKNMKKSNAADLPETTILELDGLLYNYKR